MRAATPLPPTLWAGCCAWPIRDLGRGLPEAHPEAESPGPTSTICGASSTPARTGRSPSSFSMSTSFCVSATAPRARRGRGADRAGHPAGDQFAQLKRIRRRLRRIDPGVDGGAFRRARRRPRHAPPRRRLARRRAMPPAAREGVHEFHFYTLNRADLIVAICHLLGVRAAPSAGRGCLRLFKMTHILDYLPTACCCATARWARRPRRATSISRAISAATRTAPRS